MKIILLFLLAACADHAPARRAAQDGARKPVACVDHVTEESSTIPGRDDGNLFETCRGADGGIFVCANLAGIGERCVAISNVVRVWVSSTGAEAQP